MEQSQFNMYNATVKSLAQKYGYVFGGRDDAIGEYHLKIAEILAKGLLPGKTEMNAILTRFSFDAYHRENKTIKRSKYTLVYEKKEADNATNVDNFLPDLNSTSIDQQVIYIDAITALFKLNEHDATNVAIIHELQNGHDQHTISEKLNLAGSTISRRIRKIKENFELALGNPFVA